MCVELHLFSLWLPQLLPQWSTIWATSPPNCWYTLHPDDICNVQKSCTSIDDCIKKPWKDSYSPKVHSCTPPKSNIDTKNDCLENVSPFKHGYFGYLCSILGGGTNMSLFLVPFFLCQILYRHLPPPPWWNQLRSQKRLPTSEKKQGWRAKSSNPGTSTSNSSQGNPRWKTEKIWDSLGSKDKSRS